MTLDVLICTIDTGIRHIPSVILPQAEGIHWTVSMQYTDKASLDMIPPELGERPVVSLTLLEGRGLSRNRNNAILHANGDILLMADDDCRYTIEGLRSVIHSFELMPQADILCFAAADYAGRPMKQYPEQVMSYRMAASRGYYLSSIEMSFRAGLGLRFDERFGLGSEQLCAGEEDVFMTDALKSGYTAIFIPQCIVQSRCTTTTTHFVGNTNLQLTKGATFKYVFGTTKAVWRSIKEAAWWLIHRKANPFPILYNMLRGIWTLR